MQNLKPQANPLCLYVLENWCVNFCILTSSCISMVYQAPYTVFPLICVALSNMWKLQCSSRSCGIQCYFRQKHQTLMLPARGYELIPARIGCKVLYWRLTYSWSLLTDVYKVKEEIMWDKRWTVFKKNRPNFVWGGFLVKILAGCLEKDTFLEEAQMIVIVMYGKMRCTYIVMRFYFKTESLIIISSLCLLLVNKFTTNPEQKYWEIYQKISFFPMLHRR